jgi:hypothetical protein
MCGGYILVNAEKFTDMQIHVGRYTAAIEVCVCVCVSAHMPMHARTYVCACIIKL